MKRKCRVNCSWSGDFAYVIGLFASDGNLSPDLRHLTLTSKDIDMVLTAREILGITNKIGTKARGGSMEKKYFVLQFGDKNFYEFLLSIGLTPAKSKTLGPLAIPKEYFMDFFRGCIDGDGSIGSYSHPESKHPQIRLRLCSVSTPFLVWALEMLQGCTAITGGAILPGKRVYSLSFGKADSLILLRSMYHTDSLPALERKRLIAKQILGE